MKRYIIAVTLILSQSALAWGPTGHRAAAEVARLHLSTSARSALAGALGGGSIGEAAIWPDEIKSDKSWSFASWYHFEKIGDGISYLENLAAMPDWQRKKGGAVMAILQAQELFLSPKASPAEKRAALKFLIHLIPDLHQPLHTGRPDDNGGNKTMKPWQGEMVSLHAIWDSQMLNTGHADLWAQAATSDRGRVYASYLASKFAKGGVANGASDDLGEWLQESLDLRQDVYKYMNEDQANYTKRFLGVVDRRVYLGGLRLARVLERLLNPAPAEPMPSQQARLKSEIEAITGPLSGIIQFRPRPNFIVADPCEHQH